MDHVRPLASLKDNAEIRQMTSLQPAPGSAHAATSANRIFGGWQGAAPAGRADRSDRGGREATRTDRSRGLRRRRAAFTGLLDELCEELPSCAKRSIRRGAGCRAKSRAACMPRWSRLRGSFHHADGGGGGRRGGGNSWRHGGSGEPERAYVNNGGDIALHLAGGEHFHRGPGGSARTSAGLMQTTIINADDPARGIATSGRHGRSFSLGIADAVTVLARTAAQADAAATIIANAVDLPGHPAIVRCPAHDLQPDSDLGARRLVTRDVGELSSIRDRGGA